MRSLPAAVLILAMAAALLPEGPRYAAEHRLHRATATFQSLVAGPHAVPDLDRALAQIGSTALGAAPALPGDWRPINLAGSAFLLAHRPDRALDTYGKALELGERPELDLNLGRAYASLGRRERAVSAFLRAGWVSPAVLEGLPKEVREPLWLEIGRLEQRLVTGRLPGPPPLPLEGLGQSGGG